MAATASSVRSLGPNRRVMKDAPGLRTHRRRVGRAAQSGTTSAEVPRTQFSAAVLSRQLASLCGLTISRIRGVYGGRTVPTCVRHCAVDSLGGTSRGKYCDGPSRPTICFASRRWARSQLTLDDADACIVDRHPATPGHGHGRPLPFGRRSIQSLPDPIRWRQAGRR